MVPSSHARVILGAALLVGIGSVACTGSVSEGGLPDPTADANVPAPPPPDAHVPVPPFDLVADGHAVDLVVDPEDEPAVIRAVGDLQADVERVSGVSPAVASSTVGTSGPRAVLVGTVGQSAVIDDLVARHLLAVETLAGKREAYVIRTVDAPAPGVERALVVAGSDRRGTIYGIYDLSETIGVSPWYWWADVAPHHQDTVTVSGEPRGHGEPSFRYRGIFINDEENFVAWAGSLDPGKAPGPETYKRVFELLLRLKANFLWPALHKISKEFNRYPENVANAERYGIVIGSGDSMMRTNSKEWAPWASAHLVNGVAPEYDYTKDPDAVHEYWDARAAEVGAHENAFSVGMRGFNDTPINGADDATIEAKLALMKTIFADQQEIVAARSMPAVRPSTQVFLPYKEVLDLYDAGLEVPEDVTLVWPEDNHGYVRQLPDAVERARPGGSGVYYHLSYWGPPGQSYLWLNTTPLALEREELRKVFDHGGHELLVVNVGDIKPAELGMEMALRLGYDADDFADDDVRRFVATLAARDFGPEHASEIADIVTRYFQINIARRPEFMKKGVYSLVAYGDEAQERADELAALVASAEAIWHDLPADRADAFYEMVLYPLRASRLTFDKYVAADRTDLYAAQGRRRSVARYRAAATAAQDGIVADLATWNGDLASGKWAKIMNPYNTQQPVIGGLPALADAPAASPAAPLGVVIEGQKQEGGTLAFSAYTRDTRFIDVFTRADSGFTWSATTSAPWIHLDATSGTIVDEKRLHVTFDWAALPVGDSTGTIRIASATQSKTVPVRVSNPAEPTRTSLHGYVEASGVVAIEAEHFTTRAARGGSEWRVVRDLGRSGDSVKVFPDVAPSVTSDFAHDAPSLDYAIYFFSTGTFPLTIYRLPTLDAAGATRLAVSIDGGAPQIVAGANVTQTTAWRTAVIEQIDKLTTSIVVPTAGYHTLHVWKVDPSIVVDRLVIDTGGLVPSYLGPPESYRH